MKKSLLKVNAAIIALQLSIISIGVNTSTLAFAAQKTAKTTITAEKSVQANKLKAATKLIKSNDKYLTSKLQIPVLTGIKDTKVQKKINSYIQKSMIDFKTSIYSAAKKDAKANPKYFRKYEAETYYSVKYQKNQLLSIVAGYYEYRGGAHGGTLERGLNFNLKTGKLISLSSVFDKNFDYKAALKKAVVKYIDAHKNILFEDAAATLKNVTKDREYYIKNGNLVLIFQEYEIAPYAAGRQYISVPLANLKLSQSFKALQ